MGRHRPARPARQLAATRLGSTAWYGWPTNPRLEELRDAWFASTDAAEQDKLTVAMQVEGFKTLPYIPLTYSLQISAWSKRLSGVFPTAGLAFWNIGKSA